MDSRYNTWSAFLNGNPSKYGMIGLFLMLMLSAGIMPTFAQNTVQGKVTGLETRESLVGVNILVKGTNRGASTDTNGNYEINVPSLQDTLVFSYIGYEKREVPIDGQTTLDIKLALATVPGEEVVVVGYGTQARADVTSSIATVDVEKTLASRPVTDLGNGLQGAVSGLTITNPTGEIGGNPNITLRGLQGSLNSSGASPLILVDGVEIQNINQINPDNVESISVLKDAASTAIYGSRAAWGAILIKTKFGDKNQAPQIDYSNSFAVSTPTTDLNLAPAAEGAEMAFKAMQRDNPSQNEFCIIGLCIDQEGIEKMREWEAQYGDQDLSREMVMGRDFEIRDGGIHFYRPWDAGDMFMKKWTPTQKHNLSVSGGSEITSYNIGLGYVDQGGVMKVNTDDWERYNVDVGIRSSVNEWLDARTKLRYAQTTHIKPNTYSSGTYDTWYYLYRWPKIFPYGTYEGRPFRSAVTELEQANDSKKEDGMTRVSVGATANITDNLSFETDYTFSKNEINYRAVGGAVEAYNFWVGGGLNYGTYTSSSFNDIYRSSSLERRDNLRGLLNYEQDLGDHSFEVLAGGEREIFRYDFQSSEKDGLLDADNRPAIDLAIGDQYVNGEMSHWATMGFFGRVNYDFKNKYLLQVNGRYDGSSRFPANQQWGFFPSVSVGYRISEEPFMEIADSFLSSMKLRGSYGSVGNTAVGEYPFISTMGSYNSGWLIGSSQTQPTFATPSPVSSALTWEKVTTFDLGMDASFFDDKLNLTFDWYTRTTSDMLSAGVTLPSTYGTSAPQRNFGEMQTKGWEVEIEWNHTFNQEAFVNITGTLSDFKEKVTKYPDESMQIPHPNTTYHNWYNSYYEGMVLGEIWGYETDRLFTEDDFKQDADGNLITNADGYYIPKEGIADQSYFENGNFRYGPGDVKYKDLNGDGKITPGANTVDDPGDKKIIGNSTPRYQYGIRINGGWKGFDASVFLQGVGKREFWANGPVFIPGYRPHEGWYAHQMDYWTPENTDAYYPRPTNHRQQYPSAQRNFLPQTRYIMDMSYLRVKNVTVGYTLPTELTSKIHIINLRVHLSAENIFEFDNLKVPVDPETDYTSSGMYDPNSFGRVYPFRRTISAGINMSF